MNLFRALVIYLKPALPGLAARSEAFLNIEPLSWDDLRTPLSDHRVNPFEPLMARVEWGQIDAMIGASRENLASGE